MTEALLNKPCWVIDILPEQVPRDSTGRYFAVEQYYLRQPRITEIRRCFTDILLKLNCYNGFRVVFPETDREFINPDPDRLDAWINTEQRDLLIFIAGEDALVTLNHDDTYMTVYNPSGRLLDRIRKLASANGLFLWQPPAVT